MIYWLAQQIIPYFSAFNVFTYVSSRAVFAALTAFLIGQWLGPWFINKLRQSGKEQTVRDDGPQSHLKKNQTPTMGGLLILVSLFVTVLLWGDLGSAHIWTLLLTTAAFAAIGGLDDYLKIHHGNARGLSARLKISLQSLVAVAALFYLWHAGLIGDDIGLNIPYTKNVVLPLGVVGFFIVGYLTVVGASNGVNLTDGLDGLAILPAVLIGGGLAVYAYAIGNAVFADYLGVAYIAGAHELVIVCAALFGAGLAFLWFNAYPAQVFMGDVGSLAIGALLGMIAVMVRQEIIFMIMSGVFVMETLSVMLQVMSYKTTGKRMFRMAPLHHHFELKNWPENQVVVRFWIVTIILVLIGLAGLKIR